jgi:hypothetical protein
MVEVNDPPVLPDNATFLDFLDALFQHNLPESLRMLVLELHREVHTTAHSVFHYADTQSSTLHFE